jgi:hypothetical protein
VCVLGAVRVTEWLGDCFAMPDGVAPVDWAGCVVWSPVRDEAGNRSGCGEQPAASSAAAVGTRTQAARRMRRGMLVPTEDDGDMHPSMPG